MHRPVEALSRRSLLTATAGAGALAAATQLLPVAHDVSPTAQPAAAGRQGGGYRLTAHVKRYYQTTLV